MSLNYLELLLTTEKLNRSLSGGQIQKIIQPDAWTIMVTIRTPGENNHLLISCKSGRRRISQVPWSRPSLPAGLLSQPSLLEGGDVPSSFCMLLRKHCENGRLISMGMPTNDRLCAIRIKRGGEQFTILAELTGHHGNIFLLDGDDQILGSVLPNSSRLRDNRTGNTYQMPIPPGARISTEDDREEAIANRNTPAARPQPQPELELEVEPTAPQPQSNESCRFSPERILEEVEQHYSQQEEDALLHSLAADLQRSLRTGLNRQKKLEEKISRDLDRSTAAMDYRKWGDLLLANLNQVQRGNSHVMLPDYFTEEMPPIRIPLDPALGPIENAKRYFKQHSRLSKAKTMVESRLEKTMEQTEKLERLFAESLTLTVPAGTTTAPIYMDPSRLASIWAQCQKLGLIQPLPIHITRLRSTKTTQNRRKKVDSQTQSALPYRTFTATNGSDRIMVGKTAVGNDQLTFRVARGRDIWLHIRDYEGPHVVIPIRGGDSTQVNHETLLDAATLAVHFSRTGRREGVADVIWTRCRNLRRYPGGTPGKVAVSEEKVIRVGIEESRLAALLGP